jgi:hypothetical protein
MPAKRQAECSSAFSSFVFCALQIVHSCCERDGLGSSSQPSLGVSSLDLGRSFFERPFCFCAVLMAFCAVERAFSGEAGQFAADPPS